MQEKQQQIKLPSAWKPDEWVCHHSSSRQSTRLDDYFHRQSKMKSPMTARNIDTPLSPKRISTARLRRQIENLSLKSTEYRMSGRKSKVKRLTDTTTPISYRSFLTYASRHGLTPPIHIPKMSKQSLKRWLDARDAYLGHNYPYIMERFKRRRQQRTKSTKSANETYRTIDYDEAISMFSIDPDRYSNSKLILSGKQRRLSRKDSPLKRISHSEINLRRSGGFLQRIKSFVQSPVSSLNRLSCRKQPKQTRTQIIYDYFDDKCVGTEINARTISRTDIKHNDQAIQVNLPRPQYKLYHEFDTSMVVGEKQQRTRSVRRYINYSDKATDTDFILNFINVEKERREEKNIDADENDKSARRNREKEKVDPYNEQFNVQHQLSTTNNTGNQIVPPIDLLHTSMDNEINNKQNGSRSTILSPTESNISVHEQLHR
ncbi:unnamed protein product [Adineta steineri]|uniref:Uncharacterized protein n=1 Tax=Adineta steineri TaxID=433720 RepID=A0A815R399_9BILA|nr:unnamed protein product [Adineta steineri]CAF1636045.1 unnamed protein product [Adineta steineri]